MIEHLSYSAISCYINCARVFKFRYIDKIKTPTTSSQAFGGAFHWAVEEYILTGFAGSAARPVDKMFIDAWARKLEQEKTIAYQDKESANSLLELGKAMLSSELTVTGGGPKRKVRNASVFLNDVVPMIDNDGTPVVETRIKMFVPGVPVPIIGYVDWISVNGVPTDLKTSSRAWNAKRARDELQVNFYLLALMSSNLNPDLCFQHIVFTKSAKNPKVQIIKTKRTAAELLWTMKLINDVWQAIETKAFPPSGIGGWLCSDRWCSYWPMCRGKE